MPLVTQIGLPTIVRVKDGALDRLGLYLSRAKLDRVVVIQSEGLISSLTSQARESLQQNAIDPVDWTEAADISLQAAVNHFSRLPNRVSAIVGLGGGRALDVAKYVASLGRLPYFAVPTSLSNDGFCSPQSSLLVDGKRRSLPATIPYGLVIDTAVCRQAPQVLTLSGVGDLVAKFTAVRDWKLAFHACGEPVDDFAALLSDGSVHAYMSHPALDASGMRLLATALMMNGIAMVMSGSSRPASGSEHLISHALDQICDRPKLHGLQVGVASYMISRLQGENYDSINRLFLATGFWDAVAADPFCKSQWLHAVRIAPSMKHSFYTVLSSRDVMPEIEALIESDPQIRRCIV
ncbi:MAG TPA: dehydrogenase [Planctomycetaceae bacterium]|nr:dehydrogenase [Planctomycetaceae bacterium]